AFARDRHVGNRRIYGLDIGRFANEAVVHHEQRIDRLMHSGGAERMAGERLGGADRRALFAGNPTYRLDLFYSVDRGGGRAWIDVVDLAVAVPQGHAHAARGAFA